MFLNGLFAPTSLHARTCTKMDPSTITPEFPEPLKEGDTIGVAAPGSTPDPEPLEQGIQSLQSRGYSVTRASNLDRKSGFTAGSAEQRTRETLRLFSNPDVDAVFCARGGNGAVHLLDRFLHEYDPSHPKPFVGYSDVTLLQMGLFATHQLVTFSGPMVATDFGAHRLTDDARNQFWTLLTTGPSNWTFTPAPEELSVLRQGTATGPLLGGCLSLFHLLPGTPFSPDVDGAVLVLEDVDEVPYRIDRMLHHLRLAGVLDRISGLVLGRFDDCFPDEHTGPELADLIQEVLPDRSDLPVVSGFPYGHDLSSFHTLPLGAPVRLRTGPPALELHRPS